MQFRFVDNDAVYESLTNGKVQATVNGDRRPTITADSFIHAKAAVQNRIARDKAKQVELAWARHAS